MISERGRDGKRLVWSSETGRIRSSSVDPGEDAEEVRRDGSAVRVGLERSGRKGKTVTLITGLPLAGDELRSLATALKRRCGCGGAVKGGSVEIQGDQVGAVMEELTKRGFTVVRAGG